MPHAANLPSIREIRALADEFGIEMSDQEAQSYRSLCKGRSVLTDGWKNCPSFALQ